MSSKGALDDYGDIAISSVELELLADIDFLTETHACHQFELISATVLRSTRRSLDVFFDRFLVDERFGRQGLEAHTEQGELIHFLFSDACETVPYIVDPPPELTKSKWSALGWEFPS